MVAEAAPFVGPVVGLDGFFERLFYVLYADIIPFLFVIATLVFLWGVIRYISAAGDEEKITDARRFIVFGIIGLAVMVSVWGLVRVLIYTAGVQPIPIPEDVGTI